MCVALLPGPLYALMMLGLPEQLLSGTRQWLQTAFPLGLAFLPWLQNSLPEVETEKKLHVI